MEQVSINLKWFSIATVDYQSIPSGFSFLTFKRFWETSNQDGDVSLSQHLGVSSNNDNDECWLYIFNQQAYGLMNQHVDASKQKQTKYAKLNDNTSSV